MTNFCTGLQNIHMTFNLMELFCRTNDDVAPMGPLTHRIISGLVEENVLMSENLENKGSLPVFFF